MPVSAPAPEAESPPKLAQAPVLPTPQGSFPPSADGLHLCCKPSCIPHPTEPRTGPKTTWRRCMEDTPEGAPTLPPPQNSITLKDGELGCDTWRRSARPLPVADTQQSSSQHRTARGTGEVNPKDPGPRMEETPWGRTWYHPCYVQPQETSSDPDVGIAGAGRGRPGPGARIAQPSGPPSPRALTSDLLEPWALRSLAPVAFGCTLPIYCLCFPQTAVNQELGLETDVTPHCLTALK